MIMTLGSKCLLSTSLSLSVWFGQPVDCDSGSPRDVTERGTEVAKIQRRLLAGNLSETVLCQGITVPDCVLERVSSSEGSGYERSVSSARVTSDRWISGIIPAAETSSATHRDSILSTIGRFVQIGPLSSDAHC